MAYINQLERQLKDHVAGCKKCASAIETKNMCVKGCGLKLRIDKLLKVK